MDNKNLPYGSWLTKQNFLKERGYRWVKDDDVGNKHLIDKDGKMVVNEAVNWRNDRLYPNCLTLDQLLKKLGYYDHYR